MKHSVIYLILLSCVSLPASLSASEPQTTRKERNTLLKANEAFNGKDYEKAIELYNTVLEINPASDRAKYNLAVAMVKRADEIGGAGGNDSNVSPASPNAVDSLSIGLKQNANKIFIELYQASPDKSTRENSIYNSGNLLFSENELSQCIEQYKKALRLNPGNNNARHNLRVAQLKMQQQQDQNQDKDKNEDQNQDNKEEPQDQQDQQQPNQNQQQQQPQPQQPKQTNSENILNAAQQNESKTRQRLEKQQTPVAPRYHDKPW